MTIGPFWTGDLPATPLRITVYRDGIPADLSDYDSAEAVLYLDGAVIEPGFTATIDYDASVVVLDWPNVSPFTDPGIYEVRIALIAPDVWENMEPEVFVVQPTGSQWTSLDTARTQWRDAPSEDPMLWSLLETARIQVLAYGPVLADGAAVPIPWRSAQLMQARNLWNAAKMDPNGQIGAEGGFSFAPFPMDWTVKNMIRPKRALPVVR